MNETSVFDGMVAMDTTNNRLYIYSGGAWVRLANYSEATYTAGNGLTLSGSQFKLGGTLSENTKVYVDNGYNMNFDLDPGAGSFSVTNDVSDTAFIIRDHINVFFPNIPTVSSTTGRKVALIDTTTGKVEKIDPASLVTSTPTLQQVITAGSELTVTNTIQPSNNTIDLIFGSDNYFRNIELNADTSISINSNIDMIITTDDSLIINSGS